MFTFYGLYALSNIIFVRMLYVYAAVAMSESRASTLAITGDVDVSCRTATVNRSIAAVAANASS